MPTCADCRHMTPLAEEGGVVVCVVMLDYRPYDQPATCGYFLPRPTDASPAKAR